MSGPRTDDFRVEWKDSQWVVTFTPTGARFYFGDDGMETRSSDFGRPSGRYADGLRSAGSGANGRAYRLCSAGACALNLMPRPCLRASKAIQSRITALSMTE